MKLFIQKLLVIIGLLSLAPAFSYAASVSCTPEYNVDLVGQSITITAEVLDGSGSNYVFTWDGDDGFDKNGQTVTHEYSQAGLMRIAVTASSTDSSDLLEGSCTINIYADDESLPAPSASCEASVDTGVIGQNITWYSDISNPLGGDYSLNWTGDDLTSNDINPEIEYTTSGNKNATIVSFESRYGSETPIYNGKISNIACAYPVNIVSEEIHNPSGLNVTGSCSAADTSVVLGNSTTWESNFEISGGASPYQISWTDSEGSMGTGASVVKTYSTTGTKTAYVTIDDNAGQTVQKNCGSVTVQSSGGSNGGSGSNNGGNNNNDTATTTSSTDNNNGRGGSVADEVEYTDEQIEELVNALNLLHWINPLPPLNAEANVAEGTATGTDENLAGLNDGESTSTTPLAAAVGLIGNNINWLILVIIILIAGALYYFFAIRKKKSEPNPEIKK
jgi:hypothetical protein